MSALFDPWSHPHRRYNPLSGEWVLVSPQRAQRPWLGAQASQTVSPGQDYDGDCYLCPGNTRATGQHNPDYRKTFVFRNDFPAMRSDTPPPLGSEPLFELGPALGEARVLCFSPNHALTLAELDQSAVRAVVDAWCDQAAELADHYSYVQIFENKGEMMGCSNAHPHGQIWASEHVPTIIATEDRRQSEWLEQHGSPMLQQLIDRELDLQARVVDSNDHWLVIVPWWAAWPFETLLIAKDNLVRLGDLVDDCRESLAEMISRLTARYDNLFGISFPYSMGWHQAPRTTADPAAWRLHAHFYPPLLRSAAVRKFMVGYEMMAEAQRDMTPEQAAERLRNLPHRLIART